MIEGEHLNVYVETRQVNVIIVDGQRRTNPKEMKLCDIPTMLRDMLRDMYPPIAVSYIIKSDRWNTTCFETFADVQRTARNGDTVAIRVHRRQGESVTSSAASSISSMVRGATKPATRWHRSVDRRGRLPKA